VHDTTLLTRCDDQLTGPLMSAERSSTGALRRFNRILRLVRCAGARPKAPDAGGAGGPTGSARARGPRAEQQYEQ
jgi:hypothetical protein